MSVGRATVGYLYALELVPLNSQATVGTIMRIFSSSVAIFVTLYYYLISKYWVWLQVFGLTLNLIAVIGTVFMPESPRYLLNTKRYDECRAVLSLIGRFNGKDGPFKGIFDREILEK